jgi:ABC-type uncharacterized transport system substrate-binding protein
MRRREFVTLMGGAAAAWPVLARGQPAVTPIIGIVGSTTAVGWASQEAAFRKGLGEAGYTEGHNVSIESRWADGHYDRLPAIVELVQRRVAVIVAFTTPAARAAKSATASVPIVFSTIANPVEIGLVASLNRPGGNVTGATLLSLEIDPKLLELLHETVPKATVIALLVNPNNPTAERASKNLLAAARTVGLQLHIVQATSESDLETAFAKVHDLNAGGLVIPRDAFFSSHNDQLAALTTRYALPAIYQDRAFAAAGGLMSYTSGDADTYRQLGNYTGRILKGEKPADLPVVQTTKVELVINLKTAKALGITVPNTLIGRADEVIE